MIEKRRQGYRSARRPQNLSRSSSRATSSNKRRVGVPKMIFLPISMVFWLFILYVILHYMRPVGNIAANGDNEEIVKILRNVEVNHYPNIAINDSKSAMVESGGVQKRNLHDELRQAKNGMDFNATRPTIYSGIPIVDMPLKRAWPPMWPAGQRLTRGVKHPNILFILSDDHSAEAVGFRGMKARLGELANTTRLNKLASQGAVIENCFCALALCSPSRASILTGQYPHSHGVTILRGKLRNFSQTYVNTLSKEGYATALFGKWHIESPPRGFSTYDVLFRQGNYTDPLFINEGHWNPYQSTPMKRKMGVPEYGEGAGIINAKAMNWLKRWNTESTAPFLLHIHYKESHEPWEYPSRYEHAIDFGGQPSQMIDPDGGLEQKDHYNAKFGSKIPEPPTLLSPPAGHAGPNGSLAIGWPLEKLLLRMAGVVKGFTYGRAQIPNTTNSEYIAAVNASLPPYNDSAPLRQLAHRKLVSDYLRTVKHMDDRIGELLDYLDTMDEKNKELEAQHDFDVLSSTSHHNGSAGVWRGDRGVPIVQNPFALFGSIFENTIVVYTSDQGYFLGEHNLFGKRFMWEPSIRVPCAIRYPAQIPPGLQVSGQISNVDWAPLLLDLSGIPPASKMPYTMHGRSFRALLTMNRTTLKVTTDMDSGKDFFYRYYDHQSLTANAGGSMRPSHLGVRTPEGYKLILYDGLRCWVRSPFELFDLNADPYESQNLFFEYNLHNKSLVRQLQSRLAWLVSHHIDNHISGSFLPRSCGSDYSSAAWSQCMLHTSPCQPPLTCDFNVIRNGTIGVLRSRLRLSPHQICTVINGLVANNSLKSLTDAQDRSHTSNISPSSLSWASSVYAIDSPALRLGRLDQEINKTLSFLSNEVHLNNLQLKNIVQEMPSLLGASVESELRPRYEFVRNRFNFTEVQLTRIVVAAPAVLSCSIKEVLDPKLAFLESRLRLSRAQQRKIVLVLISRLVPAAPTVGTLVVGNTAHGEELTLAALNEILRHLQSELDITSPQLRKIIVATPKVLVLEPKSISDLLGIFRNEYSFTDEDVTKLILSIPSILLNDIMDIIDPMLKFYHANLDCGQPLSLDKVTSSATTIVQAQTLGKCLAQNPRLFAGNHIERNFQRFKVLKTAVDLTGGEVRLGPPLTLKLLELRQDEFRAWASRWENSITVKQRERASRILASERLLAFYQNVNPQQASKVDDILTMFKGRYNELFEKLRKKYSAFP